MAKLVIKEGVQPHLIRIVAALANVATSWYGTPELTITAGIDGQHQASSLHYALRAVDVRSHDIPTQSLKDLFVAQIKAELGAGYQVIVENLGSANEHVHIEYDPR